MINLSTHSDFGDVADSVLFANQYMRYALNLLKRHQNRHQLQYLLTIKTAKLLI